MAGPPRKCALLLSAIRRGVNLTHARAQNKVSYISLLGHLYGRMVPSGGDGPSISGSSRPGPTARALGSQESFVASSKISTKRHNLSSILSEVEISPGSTKTLFAPDHHIKDAEPYWHPEVVLFTWKDRRLGRRHDIYSQGVQTPPPPPPPRFLYAWWPTGSSPCTQTPAARLIQTLASVFTHPSATFCPEIGRAHV